MMFKEDIKTVFPLLKELYDLDGLILVGSDVTLWKELSEQTNIEDVYYVNTQEQKQISFPNEWHVHEQLLAKENGIVSYYDLSNSQLSGVVPSEALSTLWRNLKTVDVREKKALSLETFISKVSSNKNALVVSSFDAVDIVQKSAGVEVIIAATIDSDDESLTHYSKNALDVQMKKLGYKAVALLEDKHPQVFLAVYALDKEKQKEKLETLNAALQTKTQESEKLVKEQARLKEEKQKVAQALEAEKANAATLQKEKEELNKALQSKNSEVETLKNELKTKTETLTKSLEQEKQNTVNLKKELETLNAVLQAKTQESEKLAQEQAALKEEKQKVAQALETEKAHAATLQKEKEDISKRLETEIASMRKLEERLSAKIIQTANNNNKQIESFISIQNYLINGSLPLNFHGWPISPDIALFLIQKIESFNYNLIIEFGSGTSTAMLAKTIQNKENKKLKLVTFEHNKKYFKQTLSSLESQKLDKFVDMVYAPLKDYSYNEEHYSYYSCQSKFKKLKKKFQRKNSRILVLVDGPPGATGPLARFPALPHLLTAFEDSEIHLVFDDYNRPDEKKTVVKWEEILKEQNISFVSESVVSEKGLYSCQININ